MARSDPVVRLDAAQVAGYVLAPNTQTTIFGTSDAGRIPSMGHAELATSSSRRDSNRRENYHCSAADLAGFDITRSGIGPAQPRRTRADYQNHLDGGNKARPFSGTTKSSDAIV